MTEEMKAGVCYLVKTGMEDTLHAVTAENPMSDERVYFLGAILFEQLCSSGDGVGGVCEIVDQDASLSCHVADE